MERAGPRLVPFAAEFLSRYQECRFRNANVPVNGVIEFTQANVRRWQRYSRASSVSIPG